MFIRSRHFKFTKNCHTKYRTATFAKPLLCAALLSVNGLSTLHDVRIVPVCWLGGSFDFFRVGLWSGKKANVPPNALAFVAQNYIQRSVALL
jgi:hypothetical protein